MFRAIFLPWVVQFFCVFQALSAVSGQDLSRLPLDEADFDRSVRIQDDLFEHVNGTWLRTTDIPADKSNYGTFGKLADLSQLRVRKLIEVAAEQEHPAGSLQQKVGDFYRSFMDSETIESLGAKPIRPMLDDIDRMSTSADVWKHFGYMSSHNIDSPVGVYVSQDAKDSNTYICHIIQSGLTLPDRDYYLKEDESSIDARAAFVEYAETLFTMIGHADPKLAASNVLALETQLAEASWERVKLRQAELRYNKYLLDQWSAKTVGVDWSAVLKANLIDPPSELIVGTPSFFEKLAPMMESVSFGAWQDYLRFRIVDEFAPYLSEPFVQAGFKFYQQELAGVPEQKPRWKRAVNAIAGTRGFGALGDAVGKLYVDEHFSEQAKREMDLLVGNLLRAFDESIDGLDWMTDATKERARQKLEKIRTKIGYTSKWRDYSDLQVHRDDLVGNVLRSNRVEHLRNVNRLGQPVDREEWGMTPQTVNAYYNPSKNEIVFPAAILQPPFFDLNAPDALNYGGIGAVIGHEISHAFDDQGSKYDGDGNLNDWWTDEDRDAFSSLTSRLVDQFSEFEPLPDKRVNGELTLGENIADLSGLSIAFKACRYAQEGKPRTAIAGWTPEQLFFVGWSRIWQRKYRDAEMVKRLLTDPHSPSRYRANGPVTNIDAFYEAFDVSEGDKLFRPEESRIQIW
jgi:predicted metalloendopeptidase